MIPPCLNKNPFAAIFDMINKRLTVALQLLNHDKRSFAVPSPGGEGQGEGELIFSRRL
jgi:hypothetical protein